MILILSKPGDRDTDDVMEWLNFFNAPVIRINDEELMQGRSSFTYNLHLVEKSFFDNGVQKVYLSDITTVWCRKFGFLDDYEKKIGPVKELTDYLYGEFRALRDLILDLLEDKKWLFKRNLWKSKLEILNEAKMVDLNIPNTLVTTERKKLKLFLKDNNQFVITKSLAEATHIRLPDQDPIALSTKKIESVMNLSKKFSPSLFQEYIEKEIELRVFYIMGKCYSMAIFSQSNPKTVLDFRSYDWENPNRLIPYQLPEQIETKIDRLMKKLKLNTGSVDLIKARKNGEYYFLEVNPSGQFTMTSLPCNYPLHRIVAENLILLSNEE
ncbi:grasp-with-spasm system ATP-grasp peptide maturase [Flavobacterium notoginsengisoli]|uniref:grasp-with-spasm system ATP-grasp peptide maturase n=1 Tax=Flavobacterium notoginsengisoli TaxID=1478199 RepID=UPI0036337545